MSTYYGLRKSIKADELFDGRLEWAEQSRRSIQGTCNQLARSVLTGAMVLGQKLSSSTANSGRAMAAHLRLGDGL